MTGGVGFSKDAMSRSRQNRSMLKNSKDKHFKTNMSSRQNRNRIENEPVDQKTIENIRTKTKHQNRIELIKTWTIFAIIILIIVIMVLI